MNEEHIVDVCPTVMFPGFCAATIKLLCRLPGSLSHGRLTLLTTKSQISLYS